MARIADFLKASSNRLLWLFHPHFIIHYFNSNYEGAVKMYSAMTLGLNKPPGIDTLGIGYIFINIYRRFCGVKPI